MGGNGTGADSHNPYWAPLAAVRELHRKGSDRSCLHAELDISASQVRAYCERRCYPQLATATS